jgi:hypothetical protein
MSTAFMWASKQCPYMDLHSVYDISNRFYLPNTVSTRPYALVTQSPSALGLTDISSSCFDSSSLTWWVWVVRGSLVSGLVLTCFESCPVPLYLISHDIQCRPRFVLRSLSTPLDTSNPSIWPPGPFPQLDAFVSTLLSFPSLSWLIPSI